MTLTVQDVDREVASLGRRGHQAIAVGVLRDGQRSFTGWSATGQGPDELALFEIGSVTKVFTGVLLAQMHLAGDVHLDDPLSRHLVGPAPAWRYREPTLLELATHRSGLGNTPTALRGREVAFTLGLGAGDPWDHLGHDGFWELIGRESPRRVPGGRFRYSSTGVALLGQALADRADQPYEELLAERVLAPLGMASTAVTVPAAWASRLLAGHSRRGGARPPIEDFLAPAGSVRSCAADVLTFLAACLRPPPGRLGDAISLAQYPHARITRGAGVGLCWMRLDAGRTPVLWHNGGTWGQRAFAGLSPQTGSAAVVMTNTARSVDGIGLRLL